MGNAGLIWLLRCNNIIIDFAVKVKGYNLKVLCFRRWSFSENKRGILVQSGDYVETRWGNE